MKIKCILDILEIRDKPIKVSIRKQTGNGKCEWHTKKDIFNYPICDVVKK